MKRRNQILIVIALLVVGLGGGLWQMLSPNHATLDFARLYGTEPELGALVEEGLPSIVIAITGHSIFYRQHWVNNASSALLCNCPVGTEWSNRPVFVCVSICIFLYDSGRLFSGKQIHLGAPDVAIIIVTKCGGFRSV